MNHKLVTVFLLAAMGLISMGNAQEAKVRDTSFKSDDHIAFLQQSAVIEASCEAVWKLVSTAEGLKRFAAPRIEFDLRPGGQWRSAYSPGANLDDDSIPVPSHSRRAR